MTGDFLGDAGDGGYGGGWTGVWGGWLKMGTSLAKKSATRNLKHPIQES